MQIRRSRLHDAVAAALRRSRGVVLVGPRQVGKTTLARSFVPADSPNYFDLEDPRVEAQFEAPLTALEALRGLVVIDEVQRTPEIFKVLRVLIDREAAPAKFLLLGSASPSLLRQSSESLAGRVEVLEIGGFAPSPYAPARRARVRLRARLYCPPDPARSRHATRHWVPARRGSGSDAGVDAAPARPGAA